MIVAFWMCTVCVFYSYVLYPFVIFILSRCFGSVAVPPQIHQVENWPTISLLLAAYNEENVLVERLENTLAMDYPADRLEVVVGSDGSVDGTVELTERFADRGIRLLAFPERRGKAVVLNRAMSTLSGEVILLSDANTLIAPDAAKKLARWFDRPEVSCVCGRLVLIDPASGTNADGLYWQYETFLKKCEANLGALLGANGAIYAIRRECYEPIPAGTIIDDFVIPLLSRLRHGGFCVYEPEAVAREDSAQDMAAEFRRRCRIGAGGFQSLGLLWPLLDPRRGWVAFAFLSHKVLRWLCPFFLLGMIATNVMLAGSTAWRWALAVQVGYYLASWLVPLSTSRLLRPLLLATMFTRMNVALLVGFWVWITGKQRGIWTPTVRPITPSGPGR